MKLQKGFSMVGLMAVVAIISILAVFSMPVYNQYIERTKVSKEIPVIGTYKNDIAACFLKNDSLENCNDGESGIHPGLTNNGQIMSLDVFKGNIVMIIDAQNHIEDVEPIELMYIVNPNVNATYAALDWTLYCNDYSIDNNALVKECKGLITDKDGDGYDDEYEEQWGTDPLDPDSVPVDWQPIAPLFTDWVNDGGRNYVSPWTPEVDNQTTNFNQSANYEQGQTREKSEREQDSFTGDIRVTNVTTEDRVLTGQENRDVNVTNTSGGWVDSGSVYDCTNWTPSTSGFYETEMFEQTRTCSQTQENTYTYDVGGSFTDTQVVTVEEERQAEGTGALWVGISNSTSTWINDGGRSYTGAWGPAPTNQTSNFNQTRPYTQEQERTVEVREQNQLTNAIRVLSSTTENQTLTGQETRPVVVTSTPWQNTGPVFGCNAWSPAESTIAQGVNFTQTRDCMQKQGKTYTYTASGSSIGSMSTTRDISVEESRQATGTNTSIVWLPIGPAYGNWTNIGGKNYTGSWTPAASTQTSGFSQSRPYTQAQQRSVSQREQNQSTNAIRVVSTSTQSRNLNLADNRSVVVTSSGWVNSGSAYSCGAWSPAINGQSSNFTQSRSCSQNQTATYSYNIGGSHSTSRTINTNQTQTVQVSGSLGGGGSSWSDWTIYNTTCGSWGPLESAVDQGVSYDKTRNCTDYRERFKYFVINGQVVDSDRETRTRPRTETRIATGTKVIYGNWTMVGYNQAFFPNSEADYICSTVSSIPGPDCSFLQSGLGGPEPTPNNSCLIDEKAIYLTYYQGAGSNWLSMYYECK